MTRAAEPNQPVSRLVRIARAAGALHAGTLGLLGVALFVSASAFLVNHADFFPSLYVRAIDPIPPTPAWPVPLNRLAYNQRMLALAHYIAPPPSVPGATSTVAVREPVWTATTSVSVAGDLWPKAAVYPQGGAILPFHRIVAYYGNFYSKQMGVLGEYPPNEVLAKLATTTQMWAKADPATPTIPAIQYIAVVAQGQAGPDGKWRARMPDNQIQKALAMADQIHGLLILDVQVGQSTLEQELPLLQKWLALPNVELGIDPEFSMKYGNPPGTVIGTFNAGDVNYAAHFLASIVDEHHLSPKVLIVHRFTYDMVTNVSDITPLPQVQIVMDMDGWGSQARKINTYTRIIAPYPVQFTGMKLFYKADLKPPSTGMLTTKQVLSLMPAPIYIQYQ